jgi:hypothetical protein
MQWYRGGGGDAGNDTVVAMTATAMQRFVPAPCSFGLSTTSQQYFSLRTN